MISRHALKLKQLLQRFADLVTRRQARTGRWAARAFPAKRIHWHRTRLSGGAGQLEKCFVHLSAALEGLAGRSASLLNGSRKLLQYSLGREGDTSIFESAIAVMERPLDFNDECLQITARVERNLLQVAGRIGRLQSLKANLDKSLAPLSILETMFRIESASSPPEVLSLFVSLSAEIELLMGQMSTLIAREFDSIESTGKTVNDVSARVRQLHRRQTDAGKRRASIAESLRRLDAQLETDKVHQIRLVAATQAISGKLSGMVGALQYQDILNQRLQHVLTGLAGIAGQSRKAENNASADALCFLRDASKVEAAQLTGVEDVLNGAVETLRSSLDGLAEEMRDLSADWVLSDGDVAPGAAVNGMIQVLLETIRENTELIVSTSAQSRDIRSVLEPIGGLLGNVTASILGISARIRMIALNAQIQATQGGNGTGLEVLACRARNIAEEIAHQVGEISAELAAIKLGLAGAVDDIEQTCTQSTELHQFLLRHGKEQETRLLGFKNRMVAELHSAADSVAHLKEQSCSLSASLDMRSTVLDVVSSARGELQQFSHLLSARICTEARSARLEEHAQSYTAASERAAHEHAIRSCPASSLAANPLLAMTEGSVELF